MMRSMFTGVSGLRVHQTRMDVIANNVANVNTVGFKSARATFRDAFYQNLQGATAANPAVGRTGMNPQQIGLGLSMGSIDNIMTQGVAQRTDFGMDLMIQNEGMFIVGDATGTFFTRAGNITQDARGNLGINGMQLMGWDVEEVDGRWQVNRSNLVPLAMTGAKANMPSEPTSFLELAGNLNIRDLVNRQYFTADNVPGATPGVGDAPGTPGQTELIGQLMRGDIMRSMTIFDSLGHTYVVDVRFTYHNVPGGPNYWTFEFVGDANGNVHGWQDGIRSTAANPVTPATMRIHAGRLSDIPPATGTNGDAGGAIDPASMIPSGTLVFNSMGELIGMGPTAGRTAGIANTDPLSRPNPTTGFTFAPPEDEDDPDIWQRAMNEISMYIVPISGFTPRATLGDATDNNRIIRYGGADSNQVAGATGANVIVPIGALTFDMSGLFNRGGMNTNVGFEPINGNPPGTLRDISIGGDGTITGMFTNGRIRTLGQIPVAIFANPAGLQRQGANLWAATANSGSFDGIGQIGDIQAGALEMSNVDMAQEFTDMIVTQRGFQASSRLISVSDEMIQELVNLRR